jgi:hypothetical protein
VTPAAERVRAELARRGVRVDAVRLRENRTRLLAFGSRPGTLNLHAALATAPPEVLDAIATFCRSRWRRRRARAAAEIRDYVASARPDTPPPSRRARCAGNVAERAHLLALYADLNRERFGGRLPADVPLRISGRMRTRLGHFVPRTAEDGSRVAGEIAISRALLRVASAAEIEETMLHEMAHADAWIFHGSRGHDRPWRECARRAGCIPRRCLPLARAPGS